MTNPTDKSARPATPPLGSFPGYKRALGVYSAWLRAASQQGELLTGAWGKMRRGRYETEDWFQAMARSLDITVEAVKALWSTDSKSSEAPKPAWLSFTLGQLPTSLPATLAEALDPVEDPDVTELALLGAAHSSAPRIAAQAVGPNKLLVTLHAPESELLPGEYVGFVKAAGKGTPLVVVSVRVPPGWRPGLP
ncbi:MAG TPA: hypothetical protein VFK05_20265 [Polyangiaceae bacterium]|nr:hypothetical protein [Polyangiaceae bacterium]